MSKNEFQPLIDSTRNLTKTVENKIGEIDQRVEKATQEVPQAVRSEVNKTYYVDGANGDDTNAGTSASPFQTISKAISMSMASGNLTVYLRKNQQYDGPVGEMVNHAGQVSILFKSYGTEVGRPIVRPVKTAHATHALAVFARSSQTQPMNITFSDVDIETLSLEPGETFYDDYGAFFTRGGEYRELFEFNIGLHKCNVALKDTPLFSGVAGLIKIRMTKVTVRKEGTVDQLVVTPSKCPKIIHGAMSSFHGFSVATPEHVFSITDNRDNVLMDLAGVSFS